MLKKIKSPKDWKRFSMDNPLLYILVFIILATGKLIFSPKEKPIVLPYNINLSVDSQISPIQEKPIVSPLTINSILNSEVPNFINDDYIKKVTLLDGEYKDDLSFIRIKEYPNNYAYADVNNDGNEDVVVILEQNGGGTGIFNYLVVFLNIGGKPEYLSSLLLGDRIKIKKLTLNENIVNIDFITQGPNDPMCCPTKNESHKYRIYGDDFIEINK